jgi:hypothetical protein
MKTTIFTALLFLCMLIPSRSEAQVPFGGLDVFEIPCTCSPFTYHWFAPLWIGPVPLTGPLAAPDTPNLFPFYILHPAAWALGFMTPGVEACWMYAVAGCFPLPTLGVITPFTGSSI